MTEVTIPAIAYCAMLVHLSCFLSRSWLTIHLITQLRCTLHRAPAWYAIDNKIDTQFNCFIFYLETFKFLEEPGLAEFTRSVIAELNK
jgi:hypothetical protein